MSGSNRPPRVAAFRPDDGRADEAKRLIEDLGAHAVIDPMVELVPTGSLPNPGSDFVVLTSPAAADMLSQESWDPRGATVCAVGERTAEALREVGYRVGVVPNEYTSRGLVAALAGRVTGRSVEVARSDHGNPVLLEGLESAGGIVTETVLYELRRPAKAGHSTVSLADGELDAVLFTSTLTVEHFLESAAERGIEDDVRSRLSSVIVGAIGAPTKRAAEERDIPVDIVPASVSFVRLAKAVVEHLGTSSPRSGH